MSTATTSVSTALRDLYETDETAWLDAMAEAIREGRLADLDYDHLREYLTDMANRDRREVESRLRLLMTHWLKWTYQPSRRTGSWESTILVQSHDLARLLVSGVLLNHARDVLDSVYGISVKQAAAETRLKRTDFPAECPYSLDFLLTATPEDA